MLFLTLTNFLLVLESGRKVTDGLCVLPSEGSRDTIELCRIDPQRLPDVISRTDRNEWAYPYVQSPISPKISIRKRLGVVRRSGQRGLPLPMRPTRPIGPPSWGRRKTPPSFRSPGRIANRVRRTSLRVSRAVTSRRPAAGRKARVRRRARRSVQIPGRILPRAWPGRLLSCFWAVSLRASWAL